MKFIPIYMLIAWMFTIMMSSVNAEPCITEGTLGKALSIVLAQSESVQSKARMTGIVSGSSNLTTKLRLNSGFADVGNDEFSDGFQNRAMVTVEYPLTGGVSQTDKEKAQAKAAFYEAQENVCKTFITDLQSLTMLKMERDIKARVHAMEADFLKEIQKKNDKLHKEGKGHLIDLARTAELTKRSLTAEHEWMKAFRMLKTKHSALLSSYGKNEREKLKVHTTAYIKAESPTPLPIIVEKEAKQNQ